MNQQTPPDDRADFTPPQVPEGAFQDRFGVEPGAVIRSMDAAQDDPARQAPALRIAIGQVGVDRHHVPLRISSFGEQTLQCTVTVRTRLPGDQRGIHVSRLGDLVARLCDQSFDDLAHAAEACAREAREIQHGGATEVEVEGVLAYTVDVPGWSPQKHKRSLETVGVFGACHVDDDALTRTTGVAFDHITACPCVQQTMKHTARHADDLAEPGDRHPPLLTHSQRCRTRLSVVSAGALPSTSALLAAADQATFRTRSTLPREHELALVHASHQHPQFLEDVLRELAAAVTTGCPALGDGDRLVLSSTSFESIHEYDLKGELSCTVGEVRGLLRG
ncbi:MAG: GTP cyclohydrolase I FolE2 [Alphaproteobacteria bacterium]|nr:GTP cyclohydrolase I FolE2 [Alphaproteobacteria bacterium]